MEINSSKAINNATEVQFGTPSLITIHTKNTSTTKFKKNSVKVVRNINYWIIKPNLFEKFKKGIKKNKNTIQRRILILNSKQTF